MRRTISEFIKEAVLSLLFPTHCQSCGRWGTWLCAECSNAIPRWIGSGCPLCGNAAPTTIVCDRCNRTGLRRVWSAVPYADNRVQRILRSIKYNQGRVVVGALRPLLRETLQDVAAAMPLGELPVVVPVPLHASRERQRGYNQALELAKLVGEQLACPVVSTACRRIRAGVSQTKLTDAERTRQVAGAFVVVDPKQVAGKCVLVVDDVVTTGATAQELARVLTEAGAREVWLFTLGAGR